MNVGHATLAIKTDGTIWSWGENRAGELGVTGLNESCNHGTQTFACSNVPVQIGVDNDWRFLGEQVAIKTNGSLWVWGPNSDNRLGVPSSAQCGNLPCNPVPVRVGLDNDWVQVVWNSESMMAIKTDGSLWTWGYGSVAWQANGAFYSQPTRLGLESDWSEVLEFTSDKLLMRKVDGSLWAGGREPLGRDSGELVFPTRIGDSTDWSFLEDFIGIKPNTQVYAWGQNVYGELGNGELDNTGVGNTSPMPVLAP
jgi:alpha-tubulin suppressor-like RCC1 family protein